MFETRESRNETFLPQKRILPLESERFHKSSEKQDILFGVKTRCLKIANLPI